MLINTKTIVGIVILILVLQLKVMPMKMGIKLTKITVIIALINI
jgi:hypothetical protein